MWRNPDLAKFTEDILNEKLHFFTVELFNVIYGQTSTREFLTNIICVALTYSEQCIFKIMDNLYAFVQVNSKVTK